MKRIDSINARPNVNGTGKTGFHDNADLSGQDATYLTPDFMNHLQEELCNLLEMNGVALNSNARDQLYQLLATNADIDALAAATQVKLDQEQQWRTNADNNLQQLIWQVDGWRADADAGLQQQINNEQAARIFSDNLLNVKIDNEIEERVNEAAALATQKLDKSGGAITGTLTVSGSFFNGAYSYSINGYTRLPNGFILQWGKAEGSNGLDVTFPIPFPTQLLNLQITDNQGSSTHGYDSSDATGFQMHTSVGTLSFDWFAIGH
jgi:hypothetical protein